MSRTQIIAIGIRYQDRFGNSDEVCHPAFLFDSRFARLLEKALASGHALTRSAVEAVFPDAAWEE
jgi:hypothetical protein